MIINRFCVLIVAAVSLLSIGIASAQTPDEQAELAADAAGDTVEGPQGIPAEPLDCGPGLLPTTVYFSDFEANAGGWTASGLAPWEYGAPVLGVYENCDTSPRDEPSGAFSGTDLWATNLNGCYTNTESQSLLSQTFDFSTLSAPIRLSWWNWYEVFVTFDMAEVIVDGGSPLWEVTTTAPTGYVQEAVDLSAFAGDASVAIDFRLFATTVVNRSGWYVDDVLIEACVAPDTTRARFEVTKNFDDDNPNGVEVTISCNTGLPLEQSKVITESESVEFVVVEFDTGELDCEITETVPNGYSAVYFDGSTNSSTECEYLDVPTGAEFSCQITNSPEPVNIAIGKDWVFAGTNDGEGIDLRYELVLWCDAEIVGGDQVGLGVEAPSGNGPECGLIAPWQEAAQGYEFHDWCKPLQGEGPDTFNVGVIPEYPDSHCYVVETVYDGAVEVDNGCQSLTVSAGQGTACTVTNTVFFEGIPTMDRYGLAVLALLMLGAGLVGMRRFA